MVKMLQKTKTHIINFSFNIFLVLLSFLMKINTLKKQEVKIP